MKKILLMSILVSGMLFAEGAVKPDQMKTMQGLESAMATIQKGFLYNNEEIVEGGVKELKSRLEDVNSFVIENEADKTFNAKAYASTESSAMEKLADNMLEAYKAGRKDDSMATYSQTLTRCVTCHKIIRKW